MTAHSVDGRMVVTSEPAASPLTTRRGRDIAFTRILRLLLDDGTTVHGCRECDFTDPRLASVRAHLRVHRPVEAPPVKPGPKPRPQPADSLNGVGDLTIRELLTIGQRATGTADALDRMTADRNEWKGRAQKAERELGTIRRLLGGAS
jgi:hypothetical protein